MSMSVGSKDFAISTYIGQCSYTVTIDESQELSDLIAQAEELKDLPFAKKLDAVQQLTIKAMDNAWEGMQKDKNITCRSIVDETHPLSDALREKLGCCRYQSACFLILGAAANLGTKHYLQSTPVSGQLQTCYNDVVDEEGKVHHVSIFSASLKDQRYSYINNPHIFENPNTILKDQSFLAYEVDNNGICTRYSRQGCHFDCQGSRFDDLEQKIQAARVARIELRSFEQNLLQLLSKTKF